MLHGHTARRLDARHAEELQLFVSDAQEVLDGAKIRAFHRRSLGYGRAEGSPGDYLGFAALTVIFGNSNRATVGCARMCRPQIRGGVSTIIQPTTS